MLCKDFEHSFPKFREFFPLFANFEATNHIVLPSNVFFAYIPQRSTNKTGG
jgi:hypothetical protein